MPQFDLASFFVQIIYVTSAFALFYLYCEYRLLVKISQALKARKKCLAIIAKKKKVQVDHSTLIVFVMKRIRSLNAPMKTINNSLNLFITCNQKKNIYLKKKGF